jgi:tRNA nucleotidyltransferase/poly(A) polymerase
MTAPHRDEVVKLEASLQGLLAEPSTLSFLVDLAARWGEPLYLVGGFLRDVLLERSSDEVDLVTRRASELAAACSGERGARLVQIDRRFGALRLIPAGGERVGPIRSLDLSPLHGPSILEDLRYRDFTVNAMAVDLLAWRSNRRIEFIDPLGGLADLRSGQLRACTSLSFADDPLRVLRAYRLLASYPFTLEPRTGALMKERGGGLGDVAVERVRDELALILETPRAARIFRMLDEDGMVQFLLPECEPMRGLEQNGYHHLDVWAHCLLTLKALEDLMARPELLVPDSVREVKAILGERLAGDRTRSGVVKLAALLHDVAKPICRMIGEMGAVHFYGHEVAGARLTASICSRLRFSNQEIHEVAELVRQHMRVGHLLRLDPPSSRSLSRFFRLGPTVFWPLILLAAADYEAARGPLSSERDLNLLSRHVGHWLAFYHRELRPREAAPALISGHDLMEELHLSPGPLVGRLLRAVKDLQWEGRLSSPEEALREASRLLARWSARERQSGAPHSS